MIPEHQDLARYERLLHKVSHKTLRRLLAIGAKSVTYEDVLQEYRIAWLIASRAFDPERGIPWMPFLINGLKQNTHSILRKYTFKLKAEGYAASIWDQIDTFGNSEDGQKNGVLEGRLAAETVDPLEELERQQILGRAKLRLSKRAGQFLELLSNTPPEITEQVLRLRDKAKFGQELGITTGASMRVTASMILDLMDADHPERIKIVREIKELGERNCRK